MLERVKMFGGAASGGRKKAPRVDREILACQKVNHFNVAAFYDCIQHEGLSGYSMELVDGYDLSDLISERPQSPLQVVHLFKQIMNGLGAIHNAGIIHRDIKPSNILITKSGQVKISDFGVANQVKIRESLPEQIESSPNLDGVRDEKCSQVGRIVGTPLYLAPEYLQSGMIDAKSDLYACGVIMYEMLCGRHPHDYKELSELLIKKVEQDARPVQNFNKDCPLMLCQIVANLLARSPQERYQNAHEVERVLMQVEQKLKKEQRLNSNVIENPHREIFPYAVGPDCGKNDRQGRQEQSTPQTARRNTEKISQRSSLLLQIRKGLGGILHAWDVVLEKFNIVPLAIGAIIGAILYLACYGTGSAAPVAEIKKPLLRSESQKVYFSAPATSSSTVIRSMEDAKKVRLNEP